MPVNYHILYSIKSELLLKSRTWFISDTGSVSRGVLMKVTTGIFLIPFLLISSTAEVHLSGNQYLTLDQQPFFVIGAYDLPEGMTLAEGQKMGFNVVRVSAQQSQWDTAGELGLKVWHSFGSRMDFASGDVEEKKNVIRKTVERFKDHPALLYWESMDEPAWTNGNPAQARATPEGLTAGYEYLKSLDPEHPVYMNHAPRNMVETLQKYNTACDLVCVDIYPIIPPGLKQMYAITPDGRHGDLPNQTPSCVGEYVDKMKAVANAEQSVFIVLQGFAWEATRAKNPDKKLVRYPTWKESRFMAYNAISHGAGGILYFGLHTVPKEHPFVQDLARVLQEISRMTPVFSGRDLPTLPKLKYHERGSTIAGGIEMMLRETSEGTYLITSNTSIDPAAAEFINLPLQFSSTQELVVPGEDRTVLVKDGTFFDEFDGLDVHIYYSASASRPEDE